MALHLPPLKLNRPAPKPPAASPKARVRRPRKEHQIADADESKAALKAMSKAVLEFRGRHSLTQRGLAHKVGCSRQIIAHIEYRNCAPSLAVYLALCRTMGTAKPPLT